VATPALAGFAPGCWRDAGRIGGATFLWVRRLRVNKYTSATMTASGARTSIP
jgi:hypothetical protein